MKRILFIFTVVAMLFCFGISALATDGTLETAEPTETEALSQTSAETGGELVELPDDLSKEDLRAYWESFKENVSKISVWLTVFFSSAGVAIIAFVVKWGITEILNRIKEKLSDHQDGIEDSLGKVSEKLDNYIANIDKMFEVMTVFIMNSNEPASSKAEMMEMIHGVKKYKGDLADVVTQAQEDIDRLKDEKKALSEPTPELDSLIEEKVTT